jgi:hypothetical protein
MVRARQMGCAAEDLPCGCAARVRAACGHVRLAVDDSGRFVIPERFSYAGDFTEEKTDGGIAAPVGLVVHATSVHRLNVPSGAWMKISASSGPFHYDETSRLAERWLV